VVEVEMVHDPQLTFTLE